MKLTGKIVGGAGRGRRLGFPTINLEVKEFDLDLGVYFVWVYFGGERYLGAMHWGDRPTFGGDERQLEIYLLDFEGDLYGREVEVEVLYKLRDVRKFDSDKDLRKQIEKDVQKVRDSL